MNNTPHLFDHEKLNVYAKTLEFVGFATTILEHVPKTIAIYGQFDRSSTSIPLNIAEGTASSLRLTAVDTMIRREDPP